MTSRSPTNDYKNISEHKFKQIRAIKALFLYSQQK